ncbi:alanine racemase [Herbivorax sp. ANBcel31]|uniref:alanine racemase n=1 Tax=Herbivorax sp. ANBcel31 TaxID=3069754 RepID=UPI0027ADF63E|nr:alanine racemase [Herbivorax sp. ANBcel31]MDQ2085372.1 alanine racemase [Herbivorax sp. ANBcel31]
MIESNDYGFCWTEIDIDVIRNNLIKIREKVSNDTKVMAVIKSDAYGHGMERISQIISNEGLADALAVSNLEEGLKLRRIGTGLPVLILENIFSEQIPQIIQYELIPSVFSIYFAENLNREAKLKGIKQKIHIKVNTGYESSGVDVEKCVDFIRRVNELENLEIEGIFTHLVSAYDNKKSLVYKQLELLNNLLSEIKKMQINIPIVHVANSPAILAYPESHYDMVRVGTLMYGLSLPFIDTEHEFSQAMELKARINSINDFRQGKMFGYNCKDYICSEKTFATVSIGYYNAPFLLFSDHLDVLIRGKRAPVFGKARMGSLIADITEIKDAKVGDEVVIFGKQFFESITPKEISQRINIGVTRCDSICFLGNGTKKIYKE